LDRYISTGICNIKGSISYPNFDKPFNVTRDASNFEIGSVFSQGQIGEDLPIVYSSRVLKKAEENYCTTEKELLAIVWSLKQLNLIY